MKKTTDHRAVRCAALSLAGLLLIGSGSVCAAATYTWNGTTDTNWQTASNWSLPSGPPPSGGATTGADTLRINNGSNHPLIYTSGEGASTFDTFALPSGQLTVASGTLQTGTATTAVSTIGGSSGSGVLTINGGAFTIGGNDAMYLNNQSGAASGPGTSSTINVSNGSATFNWIFQMRSGAGSAAVNLNSGGVMTVNVFNAPIGANNVFNFDGGTLANSLYTWTGAYVFKADRINVRNGGAVFNMVSGTASEVGTGLTHSNIAGDNAIDGGVTKNGSKTLVLQGINTYTGDTTVNQGGLTFASGGELLFKLRTSTTSNQVKGSGTVSFNGLFRIDASALGEDSGTWQLVDVAHLNESFNTATFGLVFAGDNNAFTNAGGGVYTKGGWRFDTTTGVLSVPEPSACIAVSGAAGVCLLGRRSRKRMVVKEAL